MRSAIRDGAVTACHDVSDGGLLCALADMALAGARGFEAAAPKDTAAPHAWLFGEDQGRYVVTTADSAKLLARAQQAGVPAAAIGKVRADRQLTLEGRALISLDELQQAHEGWLPSYMAQKN